MPLPMREGLFLSPFWQRVIGNEKARLLLLGKTGQCFFVSR